MDFYNRYESLCFERGIKPQSDEMLTVTGVSSPAISGWKRGSLPKVDVLCRLSKYFNVTTDYLLGMTEIKRFELAEEEQLLIKSYQRASANGKFKIIQVCMNEMEK